MPQHFCQTCQFCMSIKNKAGNVARFECWYYPPTPIGLGLDAEEKPIITYVRTKVEGKSKCGLWREKVMGF